MSTFIITSGNELKETSNPFENNPICSKEYGDQVTAIEEANDAFQRAFTKEGDYLTVWERGVNGNLHFCQKIN